MTASAFLGNLGFQRGNTHSAAYPLLWNLAGSHDTARLLHLCGENKRQQKLAAALQLLTPGMPMIYYGDEVAMTGTHDPDCRRGMLWEESRQDRDMLRWYRRLLKLRRELPALLEGQVIHQEAEDETGLIRITRRLEDQEVTLLFHAKEGPVHIPGLQGKRDLLSERIFDGTVEGFAALVLI